MDFCHAHRPHTVTEQNSKRKLDSCLRIIKFRPSLKQITYDLQNNCSNKLIVAQLVNKITVFFWSRNSLPLSRSPDPVLNQTTPVHNITSYFFNNYFNMTLSSWLPNLQVWKPLFSSPLPSKPWDTPVGRAHLLPPFSFPDKSLSPLDNLWTWEIVGKQNNQFISTKPPKAVAVF